MEETETLSADVQRDAETCLAVAGILSDAGFRPMTGGPLKGVFCRGGGGHFVFGGIHDAAGEVHAWDPGLNPDTTNDPIEAAQKLAAYIAAKLAPASEPEETPAHEAHEETGAEASAEYRVGDDLSDAGGNGEKVSSAEVGDGEWLDVPTDSGIGGEEGRDDSADTSLGAEILDADFYEPTDPLIEGADIPEETEGQQAAYIFGDNLHQLRTSAIGLVVQISLAKQEAIWAEAGAGPDEYSQLTSAVVRDTVDGTYRGDQATYDRFVALSTYDNAARRVQVIERERVNMLTTADRATIEAFDPQADWP